MKKLLCILIAFIICLTFLAGCSPKADSGAPDTTQTTSADTKVEDPQSQNMLGGRSLSEYSIVYSSTDPDYTKRAATYIRDEIYARTGIKLALKSDSQQTEALAHEIVVGETNRAISASLDAETENVQFAIFADENHIALEGDYFIIAAAAYYFVRTYVGTGTALPTEVLVADPIVEKANNIIFCIGDGMGFNHTLLFGQYSAEEIGAYSDGEDVFYGRLLPNQGASRTSSLSGVTDSAAGGTALASGHKTLNRHIGVDADNNAVKTLTEIAHELGKSAAVISTEKSSGATPSAFTVHTEDRGNEEDIIAEQRELEKNEGILILGNYDTDYSEYTIRTRMESDLNNTLEEFSKNERGFFIMFEEAFIDKHCEDRLMDETFFALTRFNQAIGIFMEYAFYNPDTIVIITADHETGGITDKGAGYVYTTNQHTGADVPIFAYGYGTDVFNDVTIENIQIPKTLVKTWGVEIIGYDNENYPALN